MKQLRKLARPVTLLAAALAAGLLVAGCQTGPVYQTVPGATTSATNAPKPPAVSDAFQVGDEVTITYSGTSVTDPLLQEHKETIKDDGTITPPYVGSIVAAGKTPGQLQKELQDKYNYYFKNLTVTVLPKDRFYYVSGEVRKPGPEPYLGKTDIVAAISAAGDFTDFANRKNVRLTRANGQTQIINVMKIISHPEKDVQVYPGDQIYVRRRLF